ncbi:MAG: efflux RND transporter periplasmic adaptor subunit [Planctomycetota bacterium]|nr:efflux RND transporter periplasmic adaptor subunit [Planctomycetota bacterium]
MKGREAALTVAALAIGGIAGYMFGGGMHAREYALTAARPPASEPVRVRAAAAAMVDAEEFNEFAGTVQSRRVVQVSPQVMGRVREITVAAGDRVRAGQTLVVLDDQELQARVKQAEESVRAADAAAKAAEAGVEAARAAVRLAELELERQKATYAAGATPKAALDQAETALRTAAAALESANEQAKAAVRNRDAAVQNLDASRVMLSYTKIRAPMDGVAVDKYAEVGDIAVPGRPLLTIQSDIELRFEAPVSEACARRISVGMPAIVRVDAAGKSWDAVVQEIVPAMDPNSRSFLVRTNLPEPAGLKPGMFGRLRFACAPGRTLAIPSGAVIRRGQIELAFVASGGAARLRIIRTGRTIADRVEILSGLAAGEEVVLDPPANLRDGDPISVQTGGGGGKPPAEGTEE